MAISVLRTDVLRAETAMFCATSNHVDEYGLTLILFADVIHCFGHQNSTWRRCYLFCSRSVSYIYYVWRAIKVLWCHFQLPQLKTLPCPSPYVDTYVWKRLKLRSQNSFHINLAVVRWFVAIGIFSHFLVASCSGYPLTLHIILSSALNRLYECVYVASVSVCFIHFVRWCGHLFYIRHFFCSFSVHLHFHSCVSSTRMCTKCLCVVYWSEGGCEYMY